MKLFIFKVFRAPILILMVGLFSLSLLSGCGIGNKIANEGIESILVPDDGNPNTARELLPEHRATIDDEIQRAISDPRTKEEVREFLRELSEDDELFNEILTNLIDHLHDKTFDSMTDLVLSLIEFLRNATFLTDTLFDIFRDKLLRILRNLPIRLFFDWVVPTYQDLLPS